jgi:hypothetical protein
VQGPKSITFDQNRTAGLKGLFFVAMPRGYFSMVAIYDSWIGGKVVAMVGEEEMNSRQRVFSVITYQN